MTVDQHFKAALGGLHFEVVVLRAQLDSAQEANVTLQKKFDEAIQELATLKVSKEGIGEKSSALG